jgi:hypothetical protein
VILTKGSQDSAFSNLSANSKRSISEANKPGRPEDNRLKRGHSGSASSKSEYHSATEQEVHEGDHDVESPSKRQAYEDSDDQHDTKSYLSDDDIDDDDLEKLLEKEKMNKRGQKRGEEPPAAYPDALRDPAAPAGVIGQSTAENHQASPDRGVTFNIMGRVSPQGSTADDSNSTKRLRRSARKTKQKSVYDPSPTKK